MKNVPVDQVRIRRKLAFWKAEPVEVCAEEATDPVEEPEHTAVTTLTREQVQELVARSFDAHQADLTAALDRQRAEFRAELSASIREHLAEVSAPVERLYQASLETQRQLLSCSQDLRQEVARFAEDLTPRVDKLEHATKDLGAALQKVESATQSYVERFSEQLAELAENLETTNHSLFALHKSTGERIDDVLDTHKADFDALWRQQTELDASPKGWRKVGNYCSERVRMARTYLHKATGRLFGPRPASHQPGVPRP